MGKRERKQQPKEAIQPEQVNLSILRQESELWYRLHVLLYSTLR